jgi:hypothetical protein
MPRYRPPLSGVVDHRPKFYPPILDEWFSNPEFQAGHC